MGRQFRPGAGIDITDTVDHLILGKMGVAAGHGVNAFAGGKVNGIHHDIAPQYLVEKLPAFCIFGYVHRLCAEFDPQPVQQLEGRHKQPAVGHNAVELVAVGSKYQIVQDVI